MRVYFQKPDVQKLREGDRMLVDMHAHSDYSHDCRTPLQLVIERARALRIRVALTDHNTIAGVAEAMKLRAADVIMPAVEITTKEGKDVIAYFYDHHELIVFFQKKIAPYVKRKSSIRSGATGITMQKLLEELEKERCVICLPHPFAMHPRRSYSYFRTPHNRPLLRQVHAVEAINQAMTHRQNLAAVGWAMQFDKAITGGSDAHILSTIGSALTISTATTWSDFLDDVKQKRVAVIGEERKLRHQVVDSAKSATRILATKAKILRKRKV